MPYPLKIGEKAPDFSLPSVNGKTYNLEDFNDFAVLAVFFTCNHCHFVTSSGEVTRQTAEKFADSGVIFVAVSSNSPNTYPEDSFRNMEEKVKRPKSPWIYLHDRTQNIAKIYGVSNMPHFFVFDWCRKLICSSDFPVICHRCS